ncbi:MAG: hypothetical protein QOF48_2024 [Verrucomicrobiota bacterium]|jgi:hypothetical protein
MNLLTPIPSAWLAALVVSATLPSAFADSYTNIASADAFVANGSSGALADNNYGGGGALAIAAGTLPNGEFQSVLRFDLSGVRGLLDAQYGMGAWFVQSVSLQLSSSPHNNAIYNEIAPGLFGVSLLQNNSWLEGTGNASNPANNGITYNTLQNTFVNNATDQSLGLFGFSGGSSGANSYSLDLTSGLTADILAGNNASLHLFAADNTVSYLFSSRAATAQSSRPQLIIVAVPEPGSVALLTLGAVILSWRCRRWISPRRWLRPPYFTGLGGFNSLPRKR